MGTSTNQPSPARDPSWIALRKILANEHFAVSRQSQELWRAASADESVQLGRSLASPIFAEAASIAGTSSSVADALQSFRNTLATAQSASLLAEIGARALVRAIRGGTGTKGFAAELFAETASYYVSRDLPSLVAAPNRAVSISAAVSVKQSILDTARKAASDNAGTAPLEGRAWKKFVMATLSSLRGDAQ